jgi:hypothetical protein
MNQLFLSKQSLTTPLGNDGKARPGEIGCRVVAFTYKEVARAYCTGRRLACAALSFELNARGSHRRQLFGGDVQIVLATGNHLYSLFLGGESPIVFPPFTHLLSREFTCVSRVLGLKCVNPRALKRVAFWTSSHRSFSDPEVVSRPARKATHGGARYRNREEFLIRWTGFRDLQYVRVRCAWTSIDGQKVRTRTPLSSGVG